MKFMKSVGITGHQEIPSIALEYIDSELDKILNEYDGDFICVSSLAVGADQIVAEKALQLGAQIHAIIPCSNYERTFKSKHSLKDYLDLKAKAAIVDTLDFSEPSEEAFLEAGLKIAEISDILIAIWDGEEAKGKGGTADIVKYAYEHQKEVVIIWPDGVNR